MRALPDVVGTFRQQVHDLGTDVTTSLPADEGSVDNLPGILVGPRGFCGGKKLRFRRNSEHFVQRVEQLIKEEGLRDPLKVLMEIATGQQSVKVGVDKDGKNIYELQEFKKAPDHKTRAFAATEICSYLYPKRKAVEISGAEGQPISFVVSSDTSPIPQMPSDEELAQMSLERRQQAAKTEKTIQGNTPTG